MTHKTLALAAVAAVALSACATYTPPTEQETMAVIKSSFKDRGIAKVDRLNQTDLQKLCTATGNNPPKDVRERLEKAARATVRYPAYGKWLGDFKQGERIAQTGVGMQWSDGPNTVNGGNCYACHALDPKEVAAGNLGPSLTGYGALRGSGEEIVKYTYDKLYNTQATVACSNMPRVGHNGILTPEQVADVTAYLVSPESSLNQKK